MIDPEKRGEQKSSESAFTLEHEETARGIREYEQAFDLSDNEMKELIADKEVLDMGSGIGMFATESILESKRDSTHKPAKRIDSLNIRYGMDDYKEMFQQTIENNEKLKTFFSNPEGQQAFKEAEKNFIGLDWKNLEVLASAKKYDVIMSVFAFPYYSDFRFSKPESQEEFVAYQQKTQDSLSFGNESKAIFAQIAHLLKPEGVGLFRTEFPYWSWENATDQFKDDFQKFFEQKGVTVEMKQVSSRLVIKCKKSV